MRFLFALAAMIAAGALLVLIARAALRPPVPVQPNVAAPATVVNRCNSGACNEAGGMLTAFGTE